MGVKNKEVGIKNEEIDSEFEEVRCFLEGEQFENEGICINFEEVE